MSYCKKIEPEFDSDSEDGRLASLDALRMALSTAPFFKDLHNVHTNDSEIFSDFYGLPDECAIKMKNVTFAYKQIPVLDQINIQVPKGRIYALLGEYFPDFFKLHFRYENYIFQTMKA